MLPAAPLCVLFVLFVCSFIQYISLNLNSSNKFFSSRGFSYFVNLSGLRLNLTRTTDIPFHVTILPAWVSHWLHGETNVYVIHSVRFYTSSLQTLMAHKTS